MPYLVDGNNVMAQHVGWHKDKRAARRRLLDELAQFAKDRPATITVVFDGAPEPHFADGSTYKGVKVFYAERGSNADERIKQFVEAAKDRRTLLVVTSDRALAEYVRRCGARVLRSGQFRQRMVESSLKDAEEQEDDQAAIPGKDLDQWMRYFGAEDDD